MPLFIPVLWVVGAAAAVVGTAVAASSSSGSSTTTTNDAELKRAEKERRKRTAREDITAEAARQLESLFNSHKNVVSRRKRGASQSLAFTGGTVGSAITRAISDAAGSIENELTFVNIQRVSAFKAADSRKEQIEQLSALCPSATYSQEWSERDRKVSRLSDEIRALGEIEKLISNREANKQ